MRQRYYTAYEVAAHNSPLDCWVSIFHEVFDLTPLLKESRAAEVKPLIENAGRDISHWFDEETDDVKRCFDPVSGLSVPYCPQGRFVHVPPAFPTSDYNMSFSQPWWKDDSYQVGKLTRSARVIRLRNALTEQEDKLEVAEEDTVGEIRQRYSQINPHAETYAIQGFVRDDAGEWNCRSLDLTKTLTENGIPDEAPLFDACRLPNDLHTPLLLTHWMDDLTVV